MVEESRFDSMTLDQLREVAVAKRILGSLELTKRELLQLLRRLQEMEAMPQKKLLNSLEEYHIEDINHMPKYALALISLQAIRFEESKVVDLRAFARKEGLLVPGRIRKKEIIKQLLASYVESLRSEPMRVERRLLLSEQFRSLTKLPWKKWLGRAIQVASVFAILLSFVGVVLVPIFASQFSDRIDDAFMAISQEASLVAVSIRQVSLTLDEGVQALEAAVISIRRVGGSINDIKPLIGSTAELLGEHAPMVIEDTQRALNSAEEGASAVDQVLRSLAGFGPITGVSYDPEHPLDEGISEVTDSLEPLPAAMREVGDELGYASTSLEEVRKSLDKVGDEIEGFAEEISSRTSILTTLAEDLDILSQEIDSARGMIGPAFLIGTVIFILIFIIHSLGQAAIFYVGRNITQIEKEIAKD